MTEHTPTPWELLKDNRSGLKPHVAVRTVDKKLSIATHVGPNMEGLHPENVANAEFIVRACNVHDELLGALKSLHHACLWSSDVRKGTPDLDGSKLRQAVKEAEAVIAKAIAKQSAPKG